LDGPPQPTTTQTAETVVTPETGAAIEQPTVTRDAAGESGADADAAAEPA
ncbi:MAG: hypothetical protein RL618_1018, partial [Pseudomonadota bacterium]